MTNMLEGKFFSQFSVSCLNYNTEFWGAVMSHHWVCLHAHACTFVLMHVCLCIRRSEIDRGCPSQSPPVLFVDIKSSLIRTWAHSFAKRTGQQPPGLLLCLFQYYWEYRQAQICLYFLIKDLGIQFRFSWLHDRHLCDWTFSSVPESLSL